MAKYFDKNGFFISDSCFSDSQPFIFILGGRGIGKTYSATKWLCEHCDSEHKFIFMRRTDNEMQFINTGNIYAEHSPNISILKNQKIATVVRDDEIIGYHVALSTIHNIRGFSMLDVDYILFDEFIAERGTVTRRYAGEQMLNAYETVNRNRELQGRAAVKCVFLSNFNTTASDIMAAFGFTDEIFALQNASPIGIYADEYKKLLLINSNKISEKKKHTALYNATANQQFLQMAIENNGVENLIPIKSYSRTAYDYVGTLGNVNINRLYSGYYYLTESDDAGDAITQTNLMRYIGVYHAFLLGNVYSSSPYAATLFVHYFEN